jgi:hypothetical protein
LVERCLAKDARDRHGGEPVLRWHGSSLSILDLPADGLSHADTIDVQFPPVCPPLGTNLVSAHCNHPSGKQANFLIVSVMTPGETTPDWVTTAICSPHGQYHLM